MPSLLQRFLLNLYIFAASQSPGQVIVRLPSDKFLFDTGMSHIRSKKTRNYLREYGSILARDPNQFQHLKIVGHTDKRGSRKINKTLSTARARTVYQHLKEGGLPAYKMSYSGKAFDQPIAFENTPKAWAKNRRVEMIFSGVQATPNMIEAVRGLNERYGYAPAGRK